MSSWIVCVRTPVWSNSTSHCYNHHVSDTWPGEDSGTVRNWSNSHHFPCPRSQSTGPRTGPRLVNGRNLKISFSRGPTKSMNGHFVPIIHKNRICLNKTPNLLYVVRFCHWPCLAPGSSFVWMYQMFRPIPPPMFFPPSLESTFIVERLVLTSFCPFLLATSIQMYYVHTAPAVTYPVTPFDCPDKETLQGPCPPPLPFLLTSLSTSPLLYWSVSLTSRETDSSLIVSTPSPRHGVLSVPVIFRYRFMNGSTHSPSVTNSKVFFSLVAPVQSFVPRLRRLFLCFYPLSPAVPSQTVLVFSEHDVPTYLWGLT